MYKTGTYKSIGYGSKNGMDRYAVIRPYGTKEWHKWYQISNEFNLFKKVWIGSMDRAYGSGVWIACASGVWIRTLHFSCSHIYKYIIKSISPVFLVWFPMFCRCQVMCSRDPEDPLAGAPGSRGAIATGMRSWAETATGRKQQTGDPTERAWKNMS